MCETTSSDCISCLSGYYLNPAVGGVKSCLTTCPADRYPNALTNTCDSCSLACITCTGSTQYTCQSCNTGNYLFASNYTCSSNCPSGYYKDAGFVCTPCPNECTLCSTPAICTGCQPSYFLSGSSCIGTCPGGTYGKSPE